MDASTNPTARNRKNNCWYFHEWVDVSSTSFPIGAVRSQTIRPYASRRRLEDVLVSDDDDDLSLNIDGADVCDMVAMSSVEWWGTEDEEQQGWNKNAEEKVRSRTEKKNVRKRCAVVGSAGSRTGSSGVPASPKAVTKL
jgi:hypothetical protein